MFNKHITLMLIFIDLICIYFQPVSASTSQELINVSAVSDLNQTVGKDAMSLVGTVVDTDHFNIGNKPAFDIIWSPDGKHMLIEALVNIYPKKGEFQLGSVDVLYAANANGSEIKRIAWAELNSSGGKTITPPVWSQSGNYFAYEKLAKGRMYKIKSVNLSIMSNNLSLIQKVELDPKIGGLESDLPNFQWSPKENKFAALIPEKILIYDLDEKNNFSFSIPEDNVEIDDMEWSPNGKKIAFSNNNRDIVTLDLENGKFNQVYSAEHVGMYSEKWSPDSKKLIFYEIKSAEKDGDNVSYDVYVIDENAEKPIKIVTFNSGSSRVIQWYPDSERILIRESSGDSCALYSLSMTGEMKKLIEKDIDIDGTVIPNGYVLVSSLNSSSKIASYIRTYDLFLFNESLPNESEVLEIENASYYTLESTDLLFVKDNKLSVLNTSTYDLWNLPLPSMDFSELSVDPSGKFIVADGLIFELQEQVVCIKPDSERCTNLSASERVIIKKDTNENSRINATTENFKVSGFFRFFEPSKLPEINAFVGA